MRLRLLLILLSLSPLCWSQAQPAGEPPLGAVWVLDLDGAVGPATSDYLVRGIEAAQQREARLIVIRMDTPGGLDASMRDIVSAILASAVPVATWVAPQGARAASAGTYILYASHIAAMAPATNLGAATPVSIGGASPPTPPVENPVEEEDTPDSGSSAMERKMVNDASAYIRGLAELRGRNARWAEQAVRQAASLSAEEALAENVIDYTANSLTDLLAQLEGKSISLGDEESVLKVANAAVYESGPDWRTEFLSIITNPNLVLILGMLGFYGIILEFYNPGSLVPGTIGVICLLLAGYSLQLLPVNYAGLALILVGLGLMVAEAVSPSFGILGIGGLVAFTIGGIILFDSDVEAFRIGWPLLLSVGVVTGGLLIATITLAMRMRDRPVTTGVERLCGQAGVALEDFGGEAEGQVNVAGEIWRAHSNSPLQAGDHIVVTEVSGLLLAVEKEQH